MARFKLSTVLLTTALFPWLAVPPCPAQAPNTPVPAPLPALTTAAPPEVVPPPQSQSLSPPNPLPDIDGKATALKPPPLECTDRPLPITLDTALRLSDARPLIVAIAQASAWIAEARLQRAQAYWVPALMVNASYLRHDGPIDFNQGINVSQGINALGAVDPTSFGKPLNQNFSWFYAGVGLYQVSSMSDCIFLPLAARQDLNARRWDIQTAKNDALLRTARAYFNVHRFRGQYAGALDTVERGRRLVEAINVLKRDLVPAVEVDRARNLLADLEQQAVSAREEWRVSSAELTRVLRLDPRAVVEPLEHDHLQITLIDPGRSLDDLIPIGLTNRPELASQQAVVQAALVRIRQEKLRPILPSVLITGWQAPGGMTTQFGIFGTGRGSKIDNWSSRDDVSFQLVWQLESFGFGNAARVKKERGVQSQAVVELFRKQDEIAAEITQTQADLQSAAARVLQAERSLREAVITFNKNLEGLGETKRFDNLLHLVYRPQEVTNALQQLKTAYDEYFGTVADYNVAQFQLFHALGYPAQDIANCLQPGQEIPVDTSRPGYLPPVETGPPPATR
jgi:outer membrane protein TolC